jgi:hypothetical protein
MAPCPTCNGFKEIVVRRYYAADCYHDVITPCPNCPTTTQGAAPTPPRTKAAPHRPAPTKANEVMPS